MQVICTRMHTNAEMSKCLERTTTAIDSSHALAHNISAPHTNLVLDTGTDAAPQQKPPHVLLLYSSWHHHWH